MPTVHPRWWIVAVAAAFVGNFLFANIYQPFTGMPATGIEVRSKGNAPSIWKVEAGSPGAVAGALPGDLIQSFNGTPVPRLNDYFIQEQLARPSEPVHLIVDRQGQILDISIQTSGSYFKSLRPLNQIALIFWMCVGVLELALAVVLAWARPRNGQALIGAMFLAVLTTLSAQSAGLATAFRSLPLLFKLLIYPVPLTALIILFFAFLFCANFPRPLFRRPSVWVLVCLPAAAIYVFLMVLNFPLGFEQSPERLFRSGAGLYFEPLQFPMVLILTAYGIGGIVAVFVNYRRCDKAERRRLKLVLAGALVGLVSIIPAAVIHDLIYSDLILRSGYVAIAFGILRVIFLVSLVYAVLKHRVFEIPVLLQRSGRYLLVQRGLILMIALGVAATVGLAKAVSIAFPSQTALAAPFGVAFGMGLVWAGTVVHRRMQRQLDRAFFRSAYDAQQILEELGEKSRLATSRTELADMLRVHIRQALHPVSIAIYLERSPGTLQLEGGGAKTSAAIVAADIAMLRGLAKLGRPLELQPFDWETGELGELSSMKPECLVPIVGREERLRGLVVLGAKRSEEPYASGDLRLLRAAATQAGIAFENIYLAEDIAVRLQAEQLASHELDIARSVQSKLLPDTVPLLTSLQCVGKCIQAKQVGGDYYDFLEYGPGKVGFVLADISGKGISAALLMANLQANLRSHKISGPGDIEGALQSVNRLFQKSIDLGNFATLFLGFYDDSTHVLTYANCGHAPPVVMRRDGKVHRLAATATVLGAFSDWQCEIDEVTIGEGDVMVLYSDGITEAENAEGEQFGEARLLELLNDCRDLPVSNIVDAIIGSTLDFSRREQTDDITLVVAQSTAAQAHLTTSAF